TIGYTASAIGLAGIPASIGLVFFSTRFGTLAARHGPRIFMAVGPLIMAAGLAWVIRFPPHSPPRVLNPRDLSTLIPSSGYFIDMLPGYILFGIGLTIMVAPLTTALMGSVPTANSGLGSAINNAISRVGPQLAGALIFVAITASFYAGLAARVPGLDPNSAEIRQTISPLSPVPSTVPREVAEAAHLASTDAFHLAMVVASGLLVVGAVVNAVGIRNQQTAGAVLAPVPEAAAGA